MRKAKTKINEVESEYTIEKIKKPKSGSLQKTNKIDKAQERLIKEKNERENNLRNVAEIFNLDNKISSITMTISLEI